ncbi:MAG TPA: DnaJ domain-containing protein [Hyphomicrobiaceae bacterium]|nr:DnaJ domain-containing protein [Hyphomicrobiaceae bacterium]
MRVLVLAVITIVALALLARWFLNTPPARLALRIRQVGGVAFLALGAFLLVRGVFQLAVPLAMAGVWLLSGGGGGMLRPAGSRGGQSSHVVTDHLEMRLDLETGRITGRVLKGIFAGRQIASLRAEELALLWQDCRIADPQSAQIIETYLDQVHPSWRDDVKRGEERFARGPDGRMGVDEAYEILGLTAGASRDEVRRAHRELMLRLHPDRGGSTYLAAKINEAKAVLLDHAGE